MKTEVVTFPSPALIAEAGRGQICQLPRHRNDGMEIVYLERGSLTMSREDDVEELGAGCLFYSFPWEEHGGTSEYEPGHFWHFVVLRAQRLAGKKRSLHFPDLGFSAPESQVIARTLARAKTRVWPVSPRMRVLLPEIVTEAVRQDVWCEKALPALARLVVLELCRMVGNPTAGGSPFHFRSNVRRFLASLKTRYAEDWTLPGMAAECGVHRTHFTNAVSHLTGDSPLKHLRRIRVDRARELLKTTDFSITQIALECGFQSSQHFARVFHHFTGKSARHYRRHEAKLG